MPHSFPVYEGDMAQTAGLVLESDRSGGWKADSLWDFKQDELSKAFLPQALNRENNV